MVAPTVITATRPIAAKNGHVFAIKSIMRVRLRRLGGDGALSRRKSQTARSAGSSGCSRRVSASVGRFRGQRQCVQFTLRSVHLALERGIHRALLLDAVLALEALIDHFGGVMVPVSGQIGDRDLCIGEFAADQVFDFLRLYGHCAILRLWTLSKMYDSGQPCASR